MQEVWAAPMACVSLICLSSACSPVGEALPLEVRSDEPNAVSTERAPRGPGLPPVLQRASGAMSAGDDGVIAAGGAPTLARPSTSAGPASGATEPASAAGAPAGAPGASGDSAGAPLPEVMPEGGSSGCVVGVGAALASGVHTLGVGAFSRRYELVVPSGARAPWPLVIALHGSGMTPAGMADASGLTALAEREGFLLAYPEGAGDPSSWNAGACCAFDDPARDDVGFIAEMLDEIEAGSCVDLAREYAVGFSVGGMLAYRLACELSDRIAAIASVAGTIAVPLAACNPARPVPVLHSHGTADVLVPYDGGRGLVSGAPLGTLPPTFPSVLLQTAAFMRFNACEPATDTVFRLGDTRCERSSGCTDGADVELCTVTGGGHAWPGDVSQPPPVALGGVRSQTLPITETIWQFLSQHTLGGRAAP